MTARLWEIGCYKNKTKQTTKKTKGPKSFQVEEFPRVEGNQRTSKKAFSQKRGELCNMSLV